MDHSTITGISQQARNRERCSVYVDGQYAFSLQVRALANLGLRVGQVVDSPSLQRIAAADNEANALESALRFLKTRNRSAGEVRKKLGEKGYESQTVEEVVIRLQELGLLDDTRFVEAWIGRSLAHRPVGRRKLVEDLLEKGVDRVVVEDAVESQVDEGKELELAMHLVRDQHPGPLSALERASARRLAAMLQRRGFAEDIIERVLHEAGNSVE